MFGHGGRLITRAARKNRDNARRIRRSYARSVARRYQRAKLEGGMA